MSSDALQPKDLALAGAWLSGHGLAEARPTPLLAVRLAVRRRARLANQVLLAALFIGAALIRVTFGFRPQHALPLLLLAAMVAALLLAQVLLDQWVRRVDRRAGAALPRRTAHLAQPGWRTLLGTPHAAFMIATSGGAIVLAASALTVQDATVRYAALVLLAGLLGVAAGVALQLRDLLVRPIVAEDETSLTADVIMRVEDARELTVPSVPWTLPVLLLFGFAPVWWDAAAIALVIAGVLVLALISKRTPSSVAVARRVLSVR